MTDLIATLEGLTSPDREVGREVLLAFGWKKTCIGHFYGPLYYWSPPGGGTGFKDDDFHLHDPTASLDAATALVERVLPGFSGYDLNYTKGDTQMYSARLWPANPTTHPPTCTGSTPAIALLTALLRALEARDAD